MTHSDNAPLRFQCPRCQAPVTALAEQVGLRLKCPKCDQTIKVPGSAHSGPPHNGPSTSGGQSDGWPETRPVATGYGGSPSHLALVCGYCHNSVFATTDQIGQSIVCPECLETVEVTAPKANTPPVTSAPPVTQTSAAPPRTASSTSPAARPAVPPHPGDSKPTASPKPTPSTKQPSSSTSAGSSQPTGSAQPAEAGPQTTVRPSGPNPAATTSPVPSADDDDEFRLAQPGEFAQQPLEELDESLPHTSAAASPKSKPLALLRDDDEESLEPPPAVDDEFGFLCGVCGTRLYARPNQIGGTQRCPDCSTDVPVRRPAERATRIGRAKSRPSSTAGDPRARVADPDASSDDDEYQLAPLDSDVAPPAERRATGAERRASADDDEFRVAALADESDTPPMELVTGAADAGSQGEPRSEASALQGVDANEEFGFSCGVCGTRLLARKRDIGSTMECPDCGTEATVPKPLVTPRKWQPKVVDEDYGLGPAEPQTFETVANQPANVAQQLLKEAVVAVRERRDANPTNVFKDAPPSSIFSFLITPDCLLRLPLLAIMTAVAARLIHFVLYPTIDGGAGFMARIGTFIILPVLCSGLVAYGAITALGIVTDTANGQVRVTSWPSSIFMFLDWLGDTLFILNGLIVLMIPGGMLLSVAASVGAAAGETTGNTLLVLAGIVVALFLHLTYPVILTSMLESASRVGFISGPILRSLKEHFECWFMLYTGTAPVSFGMLVCLFLFSFGNMITNLVVAPFAVGLFLMYFRLVGWAVWRLRERIDQKERDAEEDAASEVIPRLPRAMSGTSPPGR